MYNPNFVSSVEFAIGQQPRQKQIHDDVIPLSFAMHTHSARQEWQRRYIGRVEEDLQGFTYVAISTLAEE